MLAAPSIMTVDTYGTNLSVGDYNGDGLPDIAYDNSDGGVSWLENNGQGFMAEGVSTGQVAPLRLSTQV
jgi:hypothetical protein